MLQMGATGIKGKKAATTTITITTTNTSTIITTVTNNAVDDISGPMEVNIQGNYKRFGDK
jgi:hypothetical protein